MIMPWALSWTAQVLELHPFFKTHGDRAVVFNTYNAEVLSMFQSILLSLGQSINHDNALYISN